MDIVIIDVSYTKYPTLTKGRLNRMCKYFRNKEVTIYYEYNNSLDMHEIRKYKGKYSTFEIKEISYGNFRDKIWTVIFFTKEGNPIFEQELYNDAFFAGLGKIQWINSGPYCYFYILPEGEKL